MFSIDDMRGWLGEQTALGPRWPGSAAGHAQEELLKKKLESFGFSNVRKEPISITRWESTKASLTLDGSSVPCFAIPYTTFTEEKECQLVSTKAVDWKGKIVVAEIRFPKLQGKALQRLAFDSLDCEGTLKDVSHPATWVRLGWHFYAKAVQKGAAGFIGILSDQPGGTCRMYAPYGFREKDIWNKPLPGLWVSRADGPRLLAAAREGRRVTVVSQGIKAKAVTHNVVGELPGKIEETMVLSCHHDSPFRSPVEDASGVAAVLAIAKHLAEKRALKRKLTVVFTAGHFYGSIGTREFIDGLKTPATFALSLEHIALEAVEEGGKLVPTGRSEPAGIFLGFNRALREAVLRAARTHSLDRCLLLPAEGPLGDYPPTDGGDWYAAGVPMVNFISNPVYLLTDDDADRWVDEGNLARVAGAFADLLIQVDGISKAELGRCDYRGRRLLMRGLRKIAQWKTTRFGTTPVY